MGKYHVCVYAICKNEAGFAGRWMDSMREADSVCVLDTGSTDGTPDILRQRGAAVRVERIDPWRFDAARNRSLEMTPRKADICVCTDLDEVFHPGWRDLVEAAWGPDVQRLRYRYTWSFQEDGSEGVVFWTDKIHAPGVFRWVHPVHEVLRETGDVPIPIHDAPGVQLDHRPDPSKSRAQYLPLLELAVREDPNDDRNMHYLGREYLFYGRWNDSIDTLKRHLSLPSATWEDERAASMRYIARASEALGDIASAKRWLYRAIGEAPRLREPYIEMASLLYRLEEWEGVLFMAESALTIQERAATYLNEPYAWGATPHDLAAIACYRLGMTGRALKHTEKALAISPDCERLQKNRDILLNWIHGGLESA